MCCALGDVSVGAFLGSFQFLMTPVWVFTGGECCCLEGPAGHVFSFRVMFRFQL